MLCAGELANVWRIGHVAVPQPHDAYAAERWPDATPSLISLLVATASSTAMAASPRVRTVATRGVRLC